MNDNFELQVRWNGGKATVPEWTIQCDFDGTISLQDVTDTLLQRHGMPGWEDLEEAWERGEIGSRECMSGQVALLDMSVHVDPGFVRFVDQARQLGIGVQVVSDGLDTPSRSSWRARAWAICPSWPTGCCRPGRAAGSWKRPGRGRTAPAPTASAASSPGSKPRASACCTWATAARTSASRARPSTCWKAKLLDHCRANGIVHSAFVDFDEALSPAPDPVRPERGVHGMNKAATVLAPPGAGYIRGEARERAEPLEMLADEYLLEGQGERARTGILLIHGLTGTPNEMCGAGCTWWATVYAVKLAGHCGTLDDLVGLAGWLERAARRGPAVAPRRSRGGGPVDGRRAGAGPGAGASRAHRRRAGAVAGVSPRRLEHAAYTKLACLLPVMRALGIGRRSVFMEQPPYGIGARRVVSQMHAGDSAASGLPGNPWWSVVEMHKLARSVLRNMPARALPGHARAQRRHRLGVERLRDPAPGRQRARLQLLDDSYHMITIDRERRVVIAARRPS